MFDSLSDKLHAVFKKLRGESRLSESNIAEAMREIRLALLEADVNIEVATAFIEKVKAVNCAACFVRPAHSQLETHLGEATDKY